MAAKYLTMVGLVQWLVTLERFDLHACVQPCQDSELPYARTYGQTQEDLCICH